MNDFLPNASTESSSSIESSLNAASAIQPRNPYLRITKTLTYSYLFTLPLFLLYEIGIRLANGGSVYGVRIGADVLLKRLLGLIGLDGTLWISLLVLLVGAGIFLYERRQKIPLRPGYFMLMLVESAAYAALLGMTIGSLVSQLFGLQIPSLQIAGRTGFFQELVLSLGAGVYEELLFRLILVTLLVALLRLVPIGNRMRYLLAATVGALIFSWAHYIGALGDTFTLPSFTFRFLMGLALNALFLLRGFGIAAMTHALFDVFVTVMHS
jgi:hypothetical protein